MPVRVSRVARPCGVAMTGSPSTSSRTPPGWPAVAHERSQFDSGSKQCNRRPVMSTHQSRRVSASQRGPSECSALTWSATSVAGRDRSNCRSSSACQPIGGSDRFFTCDRTADRGTGVQGRCSGPGSRNHSTRMGQYPASSAWVSAVGGASFGSSANRPSNLAVWNATPDADNAGGGGVSTKVDRPAWQEGTGHDRDGRAVPDLDPGCHIDRRGTSPTASL